jgi:hypothetical protein
VVLLGIPKFTLCSSTSSHLASVSVHEFRVVLVGAGLGTELGSSVVCFAKTLLKRSKLEIIKEKSNFLRYPLNEELLTDVPNINKSAIQLIKFHGSYQQYDRDARRQKNYSFMLRTKNPCGKVSNQLYLTMDTLADEFGIGMLRLTTRQTFQPHGVA